MSIFSIRESCADRGCEVGRKEGNEIEDSNSSRGIEGSNSKRRGMQQMTIRAASVTLSALEPSDDDDDDGDDDGGGVRRWPRAKRAASTMAAEEEGEEED